MTHTQGPWTIDHQFIGPIGEAVASLCDVNDSVFGAIVNWPRSDAELKTLDDAENEANARLIASAPDLLECLQKWMSFQINSGLEGCDEIVEQTEKAIAKATGAEVEA